MHATAIKYHAKEENKTKVRIFRNDVADTFIQSIKDYGYEVEKMIICASLIPTYRKWLRKNHPDFSFFFYNHL